MMEISGLAAPAPQAAQSNGAGTPKEEEEAKPA